MKSTTIASLAAVAAISISAHAATGMPSEAESRMQQTRAPSARSEPSEEGQLGSYARYLMLNGKTRDQAIAQARNIDHAASSHLVQRPALPRAVVTESSAHAVQQ